jgi:hypothetical protein
VFFSREIEREQNKKTVGVCFLDEVSREKRRDRQIKERKKKNFTVFVKILTTKDGETMPF